MVAYKVTLGKTLNEGIGEMGEKRRKKYIRSDHINTSLHHTSVLGMVFASTKYSIFKIKMKQMLAGGASTQRNFPVVWWVEVMVKSELMENMCT